MRREFGKRPVVSPSDPVKTQPPAAAAQRDPTLMRRAVLAAVLTVAVIGGMFLLPQLGQCSGGRGFFGLDWCQLTKASIEGAARGVATGRATKPASR
jgi:hypothetical protein